MAPKTKQSYPPLTIEPLQLIDLWILVLRKLGATMLHKHSMANAHRPPWLQPQRTGKTREAPLPPVSSFMLKISPNRTGDA